MVRKGYVDLPGGQVHYRRAGERGPTLVLLHQTPMSSRAFDRVLPLLGVDLIVLALDTPGYGMSDRLEIGEPGIPDYAAHLVAALDALGVGQFALYGSHTGAALAMALANEHRRRVTHLVLSGVPILTDEEMAFFFKNLGEPAMEADGGHLTRVWKSLGNLAPDPSKLGQLHMASAQAIWVYEHYLDGLRAVAKFDVRAAAAALRRPVFVLSAEFDRLAAQVGRLAELNPQTTTKIVAGAHPQLPWTNPSLFAQEIVNYVTGPASERRQAEGR